MHLPENRCLVDKEYQRIHDEAVRMKGAGIAVLLVLTLAAYAMEPIPLGAKDLIKCPIGPVAWGEAASFQIKVLCLPNVVYDSYTVNCACLAVRKVDIGGNPHDTGIRDHFHGVFDAGSRLGRSSVLLTLNYRSIDPAKPAVSAIIQVVTEVRHRLDLMLLSPVNRPCLGSAETLPKPIQQDDDIVLRVTHGGVDARTLGSVTVTLDEGSPWIVSEVTKPGSDPVWEVKLTLASAALLGGIAMTKLKVTPYDTSGVAWGSVRQLSISAPVLGRITASPRTLVWKSGQTVRFTLRPNEGGAVLPPMTSIERAVGRDGDRNLLVILQKEDIAATLAGGMGLLLSPTVDSELEQGYSGMLRLRDTDGNVVFMMPVAVLP